jgi:hypothetical protein
MRPLRRALGAPRAQIYPALATFVVTLIAAGTLAAAGLADGFARDLLLNVGASLALVPPTYLVFAPIFERLRQTAAPIQEHTGLDRARLTDGIRGSRWMVEMMATFSSVLEEPYREAFLEALHSALRNGATVRILLLDPASIAVEQRTRELDGLDVHELISANLRQLYGFTRRLDPALRRHLEIRIYDASPSMQLFRWDDKVLISFFPLHHRVAVARQIETYMFNPLGEFAQGRFDELWAADTTRAVEDYMQMLVEVHDTTGSPVTYRVGFVQHLDRVFIDATPLVANLVKHGIAGLRVRQPEADSAPALVMSQVDGSPPDQVREICELFETKYGSTPSRDVIVQLFPAVPAPQAPPSRAS